MRLRTSSGADLWLAYGMNVHPGGSLATLERALVETVAPLRARLRAKGPFGVALRFDAATVRSLLADPAARARLRERLAADGLVPFTANGFVAGEFHAEGTKSDVYRPTWRERARVEYTVGFAEVLAALRGPGTTASISTAPGSFRSFGDGPEAPREMAKNLVACARALRDLEERTGTRVRLGLEPEPLASLETTDEAVRFFRGPLRRAFEEALDREPTASRHVGVCWDVCHQAVEHEDPGEAFDLLRTAGVPVVKVQASSALVLPEPDDERGRAALARFVEPRWLHQVVREDEAGRLLRAEDLPEALSGPDAEAWREGRRPWRVHFHVPVWRDRAVEPLRTTRSVLEAALRRVAKGDVTDHLEIETYTWEALPAEERAEGLVESLAREHEWVLSVLESEGVGRAAE
jgi:sugar phosphate isomerase/epimerase